MKPSRASEPGFSGGTGGFGLRVGRSSITWGYRGYRATDARESLVVEGSNVTVCVHSDTFEKIDVPDWLRQGLTDYVTRSSRYP